MTQHQPVVGMVILGSLGGVLCGVVLWRGWSPAAWWIGAGVVLIALVVIAWRRGRTRRPLWVTAAGLAGLAVAAVPVLEPLVRLSAEVAWSIEGSELPVAQAALPYANADSLIITADEDHVVRARRAEDGTLLWEYQGPERENEFRVPVHTASNRVLIGAGILAEPDEEMVALDAETGDELWSTPAQGAPLARTSSVLMMLVRDANHNDRHQGIDLDTGQVRWTNEGSFYARPSQRLHTQVPVREWVVEPAESPDNGGAYRLTAVESGDDHVISTPAHYTSSAGVVADHLIVHATLDDPAELDRAESVATRVSSYQLHSGDIAWEAELDLPFDEWVDRINLGAPYLRTLDGPHVASFTTDGVVDVLDLRDGSSHQYRLPSGSHGSISWSSDEIAVARSLGRWSVLDLTTEQVTPIPNPAPGTRFGTSTVTTQVSGTVAPAWQVDHDGAFGREYTRVTALDLSNLDAPEPVNLGALPAGEVRGTVAGRIVLVETEEVPAADAGEPDARPIATHILAPFD